MRRTEWLTKPVWSPFGPGANSLGNGLGNIQDEETLRGISVILAALVNHADIPVFGPILLWYHSVQFPHLERCGVSSVINANSELRWSLCSGSHNLIKQWKLQFEFFPSNTVRLVPMHLRSVNSTICEAYCRYDSQFAPPPLVIDPLQPFAISYRATYGNRLDQDDVTENFEIHEVNTRELHRALRSWAPHPAPTKGAPRTTRQTPQTTHSRKARAVAER